MKKLLLSLSLLAFGLTLNAQTVTNLTFKVTVDVVNTGISTNSANSPLSLVYATKKDALSIDGYAFAFAQYRTGGGLLAFENWLKQDVKDRAQSYAAAKTAVDNATLASKISYLLLNPDLLSSADVTSLNTIAAKAP